MTDEEAKNLRDAVQNLKKDGLEALESVREGFSASSTFMIMVAKDPIAAAIVASAIMQAIDVAIQNFNILLNVPTVADEGPDIAVAAPPRRDSDGSKAN